MFTKSTFQFIKFGVLGMVIGSVGVMYQPGQNVAIAKLKPHAIEDRSSSLVEEAEVLNELNVNVASDLGNNEENLPQFGAKLKDLDRLLGIIDPDIGIVSRLNAASIVSQIRIKVLNQIPNGVPVIDAPISSGYGRRVQPITGVAKLHLGQDFAVDVGTPIYATAHGVVDSARSNFLGLGNFLQIQHSFGFSSSYSHLDSFAVKYGEFVRKGDLIGYSGNSGLSSGPHLHYEVKFIGKPLNPTPFVDWKIQDFDTILTKVTTVQWDDLIAAIEDQVNNQLLLIAQNELEVIPGDELESQ
jgi:murein DD-endopeptidase MepM/ murein hydrolase activator NlpD